MDEITYEEGKSSDIVKPLYEKRLQVKDVIENPILGPIFQINEAFRFSEKSVKADLTKYVELKKDIEDLLKTNPAYLRTEIVRKIKILLEHVSNVIRTYKDEKVSLIKTINKMAEISWQNYQLIGEPEPLKLPEVFKEKEEFPDIDSLEEIEDEPEINSLENVEKEEEIGETEEDRPEEAGD